MTTNNQALVLQNVTETNLAVARGLAALCEREDFFQALSAPESEKPGVLEKPPESGTEAGKAVGKNPTMPNGNTFEWERSIYDILLLFSEITRSVSTILGILK